MAKKEARATICPLLFLVLGCTVRTGVIGLKYPPVHALSKLPLKQPPVGPAVGQHEARPGGGLCRPWIRDRSRLGREPPGRCPSGRRDSGGDGPGIQELLTPRGCTSVESQSTFTRLMVHSSYLALVAVDVAYGVGHCVRAQQHARAARPLGAHEVMLTHEDLADVLRACHADQRPPQQVRLEHVAVLLPP